MTLPHPAMPLAATLAALAAAAGAASPPASAETIEWYGPAGACQGADTATGLLCEAPPAGQLGDAVSGDLNAPAAGDWCNVYNASATCGWQQGSWTLSLDAAAPPCPHSSPAWCGAQHYVSFAGLGERPWREAWMQQPVLLIAAEVALSSTAADGSSWAYLCPLLKAPGQPYYLELCLEEWHGPGATPVSALGSPAGRVAGCAPVTAGGTPSAVDTFVLPLAPGAATPFASAAPGSAGTQTAIAFPRVRFQAQLTAAQLQLAIEADNRPGNALHPGSPDAGQGCQRGLSTDASEYQLLGVEQGIESLPPGAITASLAGLRLSTSLTGASSGALLPAVAW